MEKVISFFSNKERVEVAKQGLSSVFLIAGAASTLAAIPRFNLALGETVNTAFKIAANLNNPEVVGKTFEQGVQYVAQCGSLPAALLAGAALCFTASYNIDK